MRLKQRPLGRRSWFIYGATAVGIAAITGTLIRGGDHHGDGGLPAAHHYHSLLVNPGDSEKLVLGTHEGLYISDDGGRHWRYDQLQRDDAMNLVRPIRDRIWLAGHEVFKTSTNAGSSWSDVDPVGLPTLDIHGFAVDPRNPDRLYAAIADRGLYRSTDGGVSFSLVSMQVGGGVVALVMMPDGRLLAGDFDKGLLESRDGGTTWTKRLRAQVLGLAVNPHDPERVLATAAGITLSVDGGRHWRVVLELKDGAGPVAWSTSNAELAYAVGFNRVLYRSTNGGETWHPVDAGR